MKTRLMWVCTLVLAVGFLGCDDDDPADGSGNGSNNGGSVWTAPADVNGRWVMDAAYTEQVGYCHKITVHQAGTNAAVVYDYTCAGETNVLESAHPAHYDLGTGVLTVQYDLECWKDYFRFTTTTNMWRVSDPVTNVVHGVPYDYKRDVN